MVGAVGNCNARSIDHEAIALHLRSDNDTFAF
jgi:hypothetical protein